MTKSEIRLNRLFDSIENKFPWSKTTVQWLRKPSNSFFRIPISLLLIVGSLFSFLPLLGLWMLPVGLLLLAIDVVYLQEPVTKIILVMQRKWQTWRRKK